MHLVLTVGKNPLPVALAGLYFKQEISGITLVHSEESKPECNWIEAFWKATGIATANRIRIMAEPNPSNRAELMRSLPRGDLHFHYSGGTTAMALDVIAACPDAETSYFSLKNNSIIRGGHDSGDLRHKLQIDVEDLAKLHGFHRVISFAGRPIPVMTGRLIGLISDAEHIRASRDCNNKFDVLKESNWPAEIFSTAHQEVAEKINQAFGKATFVPCSGGWVASLKPSTPEFSDVIRLLERGGALECKVHFALRTALERIQKSAPRIQQGVHFAMNSEVCDYKDTFEADLVLTLGYQLLYVSCTMKSDAKEKAFEAYHRSRQIGGAGARALVIAKHQDADGDGRDEKLLHLEIGLSKNDSSLHIHRVDVNHADIDGLTDWIENYLKQMLKRVTPSCSA